MTRRLGCLLALLASATALVVPPARLKTRRSVAPAQRPPAPLADAPRLPATATLAARSAAAPTEYVVYESRWAHLFMLSLLAFVSDLVCFATASDPAAFNVATGEDAAQVIDVFLFANVFSCFFFTDVSRALGLRRCVVGAAALMAAGCALRSGVALDGALPAYSQILAGTVLVGLSQPFFQCSPPLLSATWFPQKEPALATATALNANQLGIAAAFIVGGSMPLPAYFVAITASSVAALALVAVAFQRRPPSPPTASAAAALERDPENDGASETVLGLTYPAALRDLMQVDGFLATNAAFVASIGVTNVVSAFAGESLRRADCPASELILVGAAFQMAIVVGGVVLGAYVDESRTFKRTTLLCLVTALSCIFTLGVAEGYDVDLPNVLVVAVLLILGAVIGPVQPINAELAVEVSHPADENAVEATQQLSGNLLSALLVPLYQMLAVYDVNFVPTDGTPHRAFGFSRNVFGGVSGLADQPRDAVRGLTLAEPPFIHHAVDIRGDDLLLMSLLFGAFVFFSRSTFELRRSEVDQGGAVDLSRNPNRL